MHLYAGSKVDVSQIFQNFRPEIKAAQLTLLFLDTL